MRGLKALIAAILLNGTLCACVSAPSVSASSDVSAIPSSPSTPARSGQFEQTLASGRAAKPPSGFLDFCERNPGECRVIRNQPSTMRFTQETWEKLETVNNVVNEAIRPLDDDEHYGVAEFWTVPVDGQGDCEDYVLAKRKMLALLGFPKAALRITVVLNGNLVRHAILTVVTDRGDYVLDNAQSDIVPTEKTGYRLIERQDAASPTGWIAMN
jgi:predicted transglutaminase-like cysteine proteinase